MSGVAGTRVRPVELKADWDINAQCGPEDANALTDSEKRLNRDEIEALITICDGCPVILQCAQRGAKLSGVHGVWAGTYVPISSGPQRRHAIHTLRRKAGVV